VAAEYIQSKQKFRLNFDCSEEPLLIAVNFDQFLIDGDTPTAAQSAECSVSPQVSPFGSRPLDDSDQHPTSLK
jgi:hypothetical protein